MKKMMMMSAALSMVAVSGLAQAADFNTLTAPAPSAPVQQAPAQPVMAAPTQTTTTVTKTTAKKPASLTEARIVADKTVNGDTFKKSDQGYSKISAYNVVDDKNKPITNDWTRPKSWRIGYKNKNRTPINE